MYIISDFKISLEDVQNMLHLVYLCLYIQLYIHVLKLRVCSCLEIHVLKNIDFYFFEYKEEKFV